MVVLLGCACLDLSLDDKVFKCVPQTCAALRATCGQADDGCGGWQACGECTAPKTCGGDGDPNGCGDGTCVPKTCTELGAGCGKIGDGCGGVLECGRCTLPQKCGGGGPNVCG